MRRGAGTAARASFPGAGSADRAPEHRPPAHVNFDASSYILCRRGRAVIQRTRVQMSITFLIARLLFVAIFLFSGLQKLIAISATATVIEGKVAIPAALSDLAASAQAATGLTPYELLAIAVGVVEIVFPLLIIFNIATRFSAFVMFVFVAVATYLMHDFWNDTDAAVQSANMTNALKNLSIMGGFLMLMVLGRWQPGAQDEEDYPA
jgi:putative oxidoreductase